MTWYRVQVTDALGTTFTTNVSAESEAKACQEIRRPGDKYVAVVVDDGRKEGTV